MADRNFLLHAHGADYINAMSSSSHYSCLGEDAITNLPAVFDELSHESLFWFSNDETSPLQIPMSHDHLASFPYAPNMAPGTDSYPGSPDQARTSLDSMSNSSNEERSLDRGGKPRCWDHGCNGREFSSKSNFMRHMKERAGTSTKGVCPLCGAIFTRNSARDTHLAKQSCNRIRRYSNGRPRPSRLALLGNPRVAAAAAAAASQDVHWQRIDWGADSTSQLNGNLATYLFDSCNMLDTDTIDPEGLRD